MKLRNFLLLALFTASAYGDVFMGELTKGTCTRMKGQTYEKYSRGVLADRKYDVTLDADGSCGKAIYVLKKQGRKRWAVFATDENCKCYLKLNQDVGSQKGQVVPGTSEGQ